MISLPVPSAKVVQAARLCISNVMDTDLVTRVVAVEQHLASRETRYHSDARVAQLFSITESKSVAESVTRDEMKWLYKNKFSKFGQPCRDIYDELRGATKTCPLCNSRVVGTLDHYLPQSLHADYVLTPLNLVPACDSCNKRKLSGVADSFTAQTFHPYYDVLPCDEPWLSAEIIETEDLSATFHARPPHHWDAGLRQRVITHFTAFGLNEIYVAKASSELAQIAYFSRDEYRLYGTIGLKTFLDRQADSRRQGDPHSWSAALYKALGASTWFVNGGAVTWADKLESLAPRRNPGS